MKKRTAQINDSYLDRHTDIAILDTNVYKLFLKEAITNSLEHCHNNNLEFINVLISQDKYLFDNFGIEALSIKDDGQGFSKKEAEEVFCQLANTSVKIEERQVQSDNMAIGARYNGCRCSQCGLFVYSISLDKNNKKRLFCYHVYGNAIYRTSSIGKKLISSNATSIEVIPVLEDYAYYDENGNDYSEIDCQELGISYLQKALFDYAVTIENNLDKLNTGTVITVLGNIENVVFSKTELTLTPKFISGSAESMYLNARFLDLDQVISNKDLQGNIRIFNSLERSKVICKDIISKSDKVRAYTVKGFTNYLNTKESKDTIPLRDSVDKPFPVLNEEGELLFNIYLTAFFRKDSESSRYNRIISNHRLYIEFNGDAFSWSDTKKRPYDKYYCPNNIKNALNLPLNISDLFSIVLKIKDINPNYRFLPSIDRKYIQSHNIEKKKLVDFIDQYDLALFYLENMSQEMSTYLESNTPTEEEVNQQILEKVLNKNSSYVKLKNLLYESNSGPGIKTDTNGKAEASKKDSFKKTINNEVKNLHEEPRRKNTASKLGNYGVKSEIIPHKFVNEEYFVSLYEGLDTIQQIEEDLESTLVYVTPNKFYINKDHSFIKSIFAKVQSLKKEFNLEQVLELAFFSITSDYIAFICLEKLFKQDPTLKNSRPLREKALCKYIENNKQCFEAIFCNENRIIEEVKQLI